MILTFFIVLFIMVMQFLWKYIDDLVGKGLDLGTIGELLFYFALSFIPMALPLAILLAALMTFGNMGENMELTAIKSAGVSLQKFLRPLVVFVFIIGTSAFYFSNNILPVTNLKSRSLLYDIQKQRPEFNITVGQFYNGIEGYSIKIADKDFETNLLKKILIYDHSQKQGNISVTYADSGYMKMTSDERNLVLTLYSGYSYEEFSDKKNRRKRSSEYRYPHRKDRFEREEIILELTGFGLNRTDEDLFKSNYSMLNLKQLNSAKDTVAMEMEDKKHAMSKAMQSSQLMTAKTKLRNYHRDTIRSDKTIQADSVKFDPRIVLADLPPTKQEQYVDRALSKARSAKNFLSGSKNSLNSKQYRVRRYMIEWHRKFTLSFACIIFFFIGAPLGAIIRKGGLGMPVVVSVLFFLFYHIISISTEKFVRNDVLSPFAGMWMASFILLPIGIFLTYKATNDSAIFNIDRYMQLPKKLLAPILRRIQK